MLSELVVEGVGVIDRAELHLTGGSSALTGETGAGKTLLVAALGLLRGARSDRALVREGAPEARVEARFVVSGSHPAVALAMPDEATGIEDEPVELIVARVVGRDGRSKARVNGSLVTVTLLEEVAAELIEIAGQAEHHAMSSARSQREALDAFSGAEAVELAARLHTSVGVICEVEADLDGLRGSERERERQVDVLNSEIGEIEAVAPRPGESEELRDVVARLEHAEEIASATRDAIETLRGESGIGELLAHAARRLEGAVDRDTRLRPLLDRLVTADIELRDVAEELARAAESTHPSDLVAVRERSAELARLRRKYGATEEEVLRYLDDARGRLTALEASRDSSQELEARLARLKADAMRDAAQLSQLRRDAAPRLAAAVEQLLGKLALTGARFEVVLEPCDLYVGGHEKVRFLVSANAGEAPKPISKVASGGELSRIALALRMLTTIGSITTVVFDEVDAGVGGEAARAVGACLADLSHSRGIQALVVTHLPQVAAFADHQFRVTKTVTRNRTTSEVQMIEGEERVAELSRMLAGLPGSTLAREHAQELLDVAAREIGD